MPKKSPKVLWYLIGLGALGLVVGGVVVAVVLRNKKKGCALDSDCLSSQVCEYGECVAKKCTKNSDCHKGGVCQADGTCKAVDPGGACADDAACPSGYKCKSNICLEPDGCAVPSDCADGYVCVEHVCVKKDSPDVDVFEVQPGNSMPYPIPDVTKKMSITDTHDQCTALCLRDTRDTCTGIMYQPQVTSGDKVINCFGLTTPVEAIYIASTPTNTSLEVREPAKNGTWGPYPECTGTAAQVQRPCATTTACVGPAFRQCSTDS
jgi:hypothetical protein